MVFKFHKNGGTVLRVFFFLLCTSEFSSIELSSIELSSIELSSIELSSLELSFLELGHM